MIIFKILASSCIFSLLLSYLFYRLKFKIGRKEKPCWGGVVIYFVTLFVLLFMGLGKDVEFWYLLLPYGLILLIGIFDDIKELSPALKLLGEFIPVVIALIFGIKINIIYFPPFLNIIFTILWLLVISNAINMLDIKDGLALGIILISLSIFFILGILKSDFTNIFITAAILGAGIGFFPFNFPKACAYLGDNGSLSLGLLMGLIAINFSYAKETNPLALVTPIVILGLPLLDFSYVTLRRFLKGKSIFQKSPDHLAILMEKAGYGKIKILISLWILSLLFGLAALVIQFGPFKYGLISLLTAIMLFLIIGYKFLKI